MREGFKSRLASSRRTFIISGIILNMERIGHRGACGYEPENTLASFKKALELRVDAIEFDVYTLIDGSTVVIHDDKVNRTTNGTGYVMSKTLQEIKQIRCRKRRKNTNITRGIRFGK